MSDFLFAQPSIISGAARTLDLWGLFDRYNESRSGQLADTRAMYNDWRGVGQLLFDIFEVEKKKPEPERAAGVKP